MGFLEFCYKNKKKITAIIVIFASTHILVNTKFGNEPFRYSDYAIIFFSILVCLFVNFLIVEVCDDEFSE